MKKLAWIRIASTFIVFFPFFITLFMHGVGE
jgi:hypothetical protein